MYRSLRPLLFRLDAERAHHMGMTAGRLLQRFSPAFVESRYAFADPGLHLSVAGLNVRSPVGVAAGFDKNAELVPFWEQLGFGFAEVGSVTAKPSSGNPRPRAFRLPEDEAIINRMGLNNDGAEAVAQRLREVKQKTAFPIGVNIAKTPDESILGDEAVEDFRHSFHMLAPLADYVALNVSCPNTADGTTFEEAGALDALLASIFAERSAQRQDVPVFVKLSPPESAQMTYDSRLEELVEIARSHGVAGFIASNTAPDRQGLRTPASELERIGAGGLSGAPLAERSTRLVRYLYRATDGELPIIGVGGVNSAEAAYHKIRNGASLVQLYTALIYEGPAIVKEIKEGLVRLMDADGYGSLNQAIGIDA